jgi:hypothetical protein
MDPITYSEGTVLSTEVEHELVAVVSMARLVLTAPLGKVVSEVALTWLRAWQPTWTPSTSPSSCSR